MPALTSVNPISDILIPALLCAGAVILISIFTTVFFLIIRRRYSEAQQPIPRLVLLLWSVPILVSFGIAIFEITVADIGLFGMLFK